MSLELTQLVAGACIPNPRRAVIRGGDDAVAVRGKNRTLHRFYMSLEHMQLAAVACCIPDPRRAVRGGGDDINFFKTLSKDAIV